MDENLFRMLLFAEKDGVCEEEFIKLGYLIKSNDTVYRTNKLDRELNEFIDTKKKSLYAAVKEIGNARDIKMVMEKAGIKEFLTFSVVADELVKEGKLF
ncbi:MAG: hypothetical protein HQP61_06275, partial [Peptococcaceae bacterium]|nr:hypothetical protein [Candidatus Syntrophopropionicum ammoniitolerans]